MKKLFLSVMGLLLSLFIVLPLVHSQSLTLDYSTYLGDSYGAKGIAVDSNGAAYITGYTRSTSFPTLNPYQPIFGGGTFDAFVSKLGPTGSYLIYSMYLGGSGDESGNDIAIETGEAYLCGYTTSDDFPTGNPYQSGRKGANDCFISKISSSGSTLIFSTYMGGTGPEVGYGISVAGSVTYLSGNTGSDDFPTQNPYQAARSGGYDAFVCMLSSSGSRIIFSTYLGGAGDDICKDISVEDSMAYITGYTRSTSFPTVNPYQSSFVGGTWDAFISKLSSSGSVIIFSTYYGGDAEDKGYSLSIENEEVYLTGTTYSDNFPTKNPYQPGLSIGEDIFVGKLDSSGSLLLYSTYLGGGGNDERGYSIDVEDGEACVGGTTGSSDFPTLNSYQSSKEVGLYYDAFITRLATAGSSLIYSTYLGGSGTDRIYGVDVRDGAVYVTGRTGSPDFPTKNPYQAGYAGDYNPFVSKLILYTPTPTPIGFETPSPAPTISPTPSVTPSPTTTPSPTITPTPSPTPFGYKTPSPTPSPIPTLVSTPTPLPATLPFYDGFEAGTLGPYWSVYTTTGGQVLVSDSYPYEGYYSMLLDSDGAAGYSIAAAALTVDLSLYSDTDVFLRFWWREFDDENHPEDGVFISDDYGQNWHQALTFNEGPESYIRETLSLSDLKDTYGLIFNDHFQVKFQFYDNHPVPMDGYVIDEVGLWTLATPTPTPYGYKTPSPTPTSVSQIHVPDDFAIIQEAINASFDGYTIIVRDGTYTGGGNRDIDFSGKAITLVSENGPESTIIDCGGSGSRAFYFHSGETSSSVLDGFTISGGGLFRENGAGIYIENSSPIIRNCIIYGNSISGGSGKYGIRLYGGGIYLSNSFTTILDCTISNNSIVGSEAEVYNHGAGGTATGGGIYCSDGAVTISHCSIYSNSARGGIGGTYYGSGGFGSGGGIYGPATVTNSIIYNNLAKGGDACYGAWGYGGGISKATEVINCLIYNNSAQRGIQTGYGGHPGSAYGAGIYDSPVITNCTIYNNSAQSAGGGTSGSPTITNSIIWSNTPNQIDGVDSDVTYSDIEGGWTGTWNIDSDPGFTSSTDFHLTVNSPCIDSGDNSVVDWGADLDNHIRIWDGKGGGTAIVDMGVYEYGAPPTPTPTPSSTPTPYGYKTPTPTPSVTPSPTLTPFGYKTPSPTPSSGPAIYVPDDYATIQDAINAATSTNMIIVRNGTYTGEGNRDIDFLGKAITLRSENGPENTIINCSGSGRRGFYFHSGETSSSILDGFTITGGGVSQENGGGLYINDSSPTIRNCIITVNNISGGSYPGYGGSVSGGGIYLYNSSSLITDCMISNNSATGYDASSSGTIDGESGGGGGISCSGGLVTISYCTISGNSAHGGNGGCFSGRGGGGGAGGVSGPAVISHSIISGNQATGGDGKYGAGGSGGGISGANEVINCLIRNNSVSGGSNCCCPSGSDGVGTGAGISGSAVIKNCLIYNNTASSYGGGSSGSPTITNSILWDNAPDQINGGSTTINYSDIEGGWAGTWNIDSDPQFTTSTDFHLTGSSPCIDTGDNSVVTWGNDLDGHTRIWDGTGGGTAIVDMGVYEYGAPLITATPSPIPTPTSTPTPYGYKTPTPTTTPTPKICLRLEEGFDDFQYGARPAGWIFSGCNANTDVYTTTDYYGLQAPSIRLDQDGDAIETATFGTPDDLAFWVKKISYLEYDSLLVEEYYSSWTTITDLDLSPWSSQGEIIGPFDLKITTRKIKFSYSSTGGEMALDDITIHCAFTPTPTPPGYKTPTPVPTSSSSPSPSIPLPTATPPPTATPFPFPTALHLVIAGNDYDGDGIADMAVWNPDSGKWLINLSGGGSPLIFYYGTAADIPVPGDYDGDGSTDAGIFRSASGLWAIRGLSHLYYGADGDIPVPGDYDGDGTIDAGIFRQSSSLWAIRGISRRYFGGSDDLPVPGDYIALPYLGDGTDEIGIFRPSSGLWAISGITRLYLGRSGDYPVPAGYMSERWGKEVAIFRPSSCLWSFGGARRYYFGRPGDLPQPGRFTEENLSSIAIYRPSTGLWAIGGHTRAYWGGPSYIPVTK